MKRRAALIAACVAFAAMFAVAGCSEEEKAKADVPVVSTPDTTEVYPEPTDTEEVIVIPNPETGKK